MSKEILQAIEILSNEKDINSENIFAAVESALATAAQRQYDKDIGVQVTINRQTGDFETFRVWEVLDGDAENVFMEHSDKEIWLIDAIEIEPDIKPGEFIKEPIRSVTGRIAAQAVMQAVKQKIREYEREKIINEYAAKVGQLVSGTVKRNDRGRIIVDLGNDVEALIPRENIIPRDPIRNGERIRGLLAEVTEPENRGHMLILSRRSNDFLRELFKLEVPEIGEGVIDVMGVARVPGIRAKISVTSNDPRLDPVGSCIGIRGSRVQAVSNELAGERIDIVVWDENEAQYVINAFSPAEISKIFVDEDDHVMDIALSDEMLPKAIGRNGQNIRLVSELTGWTLNAMSIDQFNEKTLAEVNNIAQIFSERLGVDQEVANILASEGYTSIEDIAYTSINELASIEEFDQEIGKEIKSRAQDYLVSTAIIQEEKIAAAQPADDLLNMEGMDERTAHLLASNNIVSMEDLANQSIDEILELSDINLSADDVSKLVMTAKETWFAE